MAEHRRCPKLRWSTHIWGAEKPAEDRPRHRPAPLPRGPQAPVAATGPVRALRAHVVLPTRPHRNLRLLLETVIQLESFYSHQNSSFPPPDAEQVSLPPVPRCAALAVKLCLPPQ